MKPQGLPKRKRSPKQPDPSQPQPNGSLNDIFCRFEIIDLGYSQRLKMLW